MKDMIFYLSSWQEVEQKWVKVRKTGDSVKILGYSDFFFAVCDDHTDPTYMSVYEVSIGVCIGTGLSNEEAIKKASDNMAGISKEVFIERLKLAKNQMRAQKSPDEIKKEINKDA